MKVMRKCDDEIYQLLRPFVENLPSHIKDSTDYLKKMENSTIPENTTLVTMG
jgi:hypothetical protein